MLLAINDEGVEVGLEGSDGCWGIGTLNPV
jgi:hypothetical protein